MLNLSHSECDYEAVTAMQKRELFPHLVSALREQDKVVLDFGCGPGRFTPALAQLVGGSAIGVDPVQRFLDLAPRARNVEYRKSSGNEIPLPDDSVDVVWICLVLGGILDLDPIATELKRVSKPDALLFAAENTSEQPDLEHWFYRSVDQYRSALEMPLEHVHDYVDQEERISVLLGHI